MDETGNQNNELNDLPQQKYISRQIKFSDLKHHQIETGSYRSLIVGLLKEYTNRNRLIFFINYSEMLEEFRSTNYGKYVEHIHFKAAYSATMNIFRKFYFLFKSFVKVEFSYVFTIKMFSTAENCMEK